MIGDRTLFTVGHSTHPMNRFIDLLKRHGITAVADVRSQPYSRVNPQFNREVLGATLKQNGIAYVFLGKELGARSDDPKCYIDGKVSYERLATSTTFKDGLERLREGMKLHKVVLMCAEKDPLSCHRTILVSRHVIDNLGFAVQHILADGRLEEHGAAMRRLMNLLKMPEADMFNSRQELLSQAYETQGERIAYQRESKTTANSVSSE